MTATTALAWLILVSGTGVVCGDALSAAEPAVDRAGPVAPDEVSGPVQYGAAESVKGLRHLRLGGQPDARGFLAAKEDGVEIVVNLRGPDEYDFDGKSAAEAAGLEYHHVPVVKGRPLSKDAFDEIDRIVEAANGRTVYLYCSSGNRASAWLAAHLVRSHGLSRTEAFAVAERTGLTKAPLRQMVEAYLDAHPPAEPAAKAP